MIAIVRPKQKKIVYVTVTPEKHQLICWATPVINRIIQITAQAVIPESKTHSLELKSVSFEGILQHNRVIFSTSGLITGRTRYIVRSGPDTRDTALNRLILFFVGNSSSEELKLTVFDPDSPAIDIESMNRVLWIFEQTIEEVGRVRLEIPLNLDISSSSLTGFSFPEESVTNELHIVKYLRSLGGCIQSICSIIRSIVNTLNTSGRYSFQGSQTDQVNLETYYRYVGITNIAEISYLYRYTVTQIDSLVTAMTSMLYHDTVSDIQTLYKCNSAIGHTSTIARHMLLTLAAIYQSEHLYHVGHYIQSVNSSHMYLQSMISANTILDILFDLLSSNNSKNLSHLYELYHVPVINKDITEKVRYLTRYLTALDSIDRLRVSMPELIEQMSSAMLNLDISIQDYTSYLYQVFAGYNLTDSTDVRLDVDAPYDDPGDPGDPGDDPIVDPGGGAIVTPFPSLPIITPGTNGYYSAPENQWIRNIITPFGVTKIYDGEEDN